MGSGCPSCFTPEKEPCDLLYGRLFRPLADLGGCGEETIPCLDQGSTPELSSYTNYTVLTPGKSLKLLLFWNTEVIGKVRDVRHCSLLTSAPIGYDWSVSCFNSKVVHAISQALGWLWPQKSTFSSRLLCVGYVVDSLALGHIFSEYFTYPLSVIILPVLNTLWQPI